MATNILVFGASTTYGCWDIEGGWVQRLHKWIDTKNIGEKLYQSYAGISLVYNLGISDETSQDILERFEAEVKPRLWQDVDNIFIFEIGKNDATFNNKTKTLKTSPDEFKDNLEKLIEKAQKFQAKIVFIGSLPVDKRVDPIPWLPDCSYKDEDIKRYNETIKSVCEGNGISFIEIYQNYIDKDYSRFLIDGVHPNSEGHEAIFEAVKDYLLQNKII